MAQYTNKEWINLYYLTLFGRPADYEGYLYWNDLLENGGMTIAEMSNHLVYSGYLQFTGGSENFAESFLTNLYENLFNRDIDADGLQYWIGELEAGRVTHAALAQTIIWVASQATEQDNNWEDLLVMENKLEAAEYALDLMIDQEVTYSEQLDYDLQEIIAGIEAGQSSINETLNEIADYFSEENTFTLQEATVEQTVKTVVETSTTTEIIETPVITVIDPIIETRSYWVNSSSGEVVDIDVFWQLVDSYLAPYLETALSEQIAGLESVSDALVQIVEITLAGVQDDLEGEGVSGEGEVADAGDGGFTGDDYTYNEDETVKEGDYTGNYEITVNFADGTVNSTIVTLTEAQYEFINNLLFDAEGNTRFVTRDVEIYSYMPLLARDENGDLIPSNGQELYGSPYMFARDIDGNLIPVKAYEYTVIEEVVDTETSETTETVTEVTEVPIILTPTENNGGTVESGFTGIGNDTITAGRLELLHQAYIDGGGGYNTLEVYAKGTYAQALALINIQEIHVQNMPNVYTTGADDGDGNLDNSSYPDLASYAASPAEVIVCDADGNITITSLTLLITVENNEGYSVEQMPVEIPAGTYTVAELAALINLEAGLTVAYEDEDTGYLVITTSEDGAQEIRFSGNQVEALGLSGIALDGTLTVSTGYADSILDLSTAVDIEKLVITEASGTDTSSGADLAGSLLVVGVRNGATLRFEGSFTEDVTVQYGEGRDDDEPLTVELVIGSISANLNFLSNTSSLHIDSLGGGTNSFSSQYISDGSLSDLIITGNARLDIRNDLDSSFVDDTPVTIDASENEKGVSIILSHSEKVNILGSLGDDSFKISTGYHGYNSDDEYVKIQGGAGDNQYEIDSYNVEIVNSDGDNTYEIDAKNAVTITSGNGNNTYEVDGAEKVTITSGNGDSSYDLYESDDITIVAGDGEHTVDIDRAETVEITFGDGDGTLYVDAEDSVVITTGDGDLTIDVDDADAYYVDILNNIPVDNEVEIVTGVGETVYDIEGYDVSITDGGGENEFEIYAYNADLTIAGDDDNSYYVDAVQVNIDAQGDGDNSFEGYVSSITAILGDGDNSFDIIAIDAPQRDVMYLEDVFDTSVTIEAGDGSNEFNIYASPFYDLEGAIIGVVADLLEDVTYSDLVDLELDELGDYIDSLDIDLGDLDVLTVIEAIASLYQNGMHLLQDVTIDITAGDGGNVINIPGLPYDLAGTVVDLVADFFGVEEDSGLDTIIDLVGDALSYITGVLTTVNVETGAGADEILVAASDITISSGAGDDVITLMGTDPDYVSSDYVLWSDGALLDIDTGSGEDTVVLGAALDESFLATGTITAMEGSTITGENITLYVNTIADLQAAELSGITKVILDDDSYNYLDSTGANEDGATAQNAILTLTAEQFFNVIGAANFSVEGSIFSTHAYVKIIVTEDLDLTTAELSAAMDSLSSNIDLYFEICDGATLTMTAQQLHENVAADGVTLADDDNTDLVSGKVVITNANGVDLASDPYDSVFDPFHETDNFHEGYGDADYIGGSLSDDFLDDDGNWYNVTVIRSFDGYYRPMDAPVSDPLVIDSSDGMVTVGAFSTWLNQLEIIGDHDVTFTGTITLGSDYTVDFSTLEAEAIDLTLANFQEVSQIRGNSQFAETTIYVKMTGTTDDETTDVDESIPTVGGEDLGNGEFSGLVSSGVRRYIVVDISDGDSAAYDAEEATIYLCDTTQDLEVIGLRSNYNATLNVLQVQWGIEFELQGDGSDSYTTKANGPAATSNVGILHAEFQWEGAPAVVNINNQGTATERALRAFGIEIDNAASIEVNVEDSDLIIDSIDGDDLISLDFNTLYDISITEALELDTLTTINAADVVGDFTATISGVNEDMGGTDGPSATEIELDDRIIFTAGSGETTLTLIDVMADEYSAFNGGGGELTLIIAGTDSGVTGVTNLTAADTDGVDAIQLMSDANVALTYEQVADLGADSITMAADQDGGVLDMFNWAGQDFDSTAVGAGVTVEITMAQGDWTFGNVDLSNVSQFTLTGDTTVTMSADQLIELATALAAEGTLDAFLAMGGDNIINITDLTQENVDWSIEFQGDTYTFTEVLEAISDNGWAGTVTLGESVDLTDSGDLDFEFILGDGMTLGVATAEQADGLVVDGGADSAVQILFIDYDPLATDTIDTGNYSVTSLLIPNVLADKHNIELTFENLGGAVTVVIYDAFEYVTRIDRVVDLLEGTTVPGWLVFNDNTLDSEIRTLTLNMKGGTEITGNLRLTTTPKEGNPWNVNTVQTYLETLIINSNGFAANTISGETANVIEGQISPLATGTVQGVIDNNLKNVIINADQALLIRDGIVFNSVTINDYDDGLPGNDDFEAVASLVVTGTADVNVGVVNTDDDDVDSLDAVNNGTGTLSITLDAEALDATDALSFTGTGDIVLTIDGAVDLSDDTLSAVTSIYLMDGAQVSITPEQLNTLGVSNIDLAAGADDGILEVVDLAEQAFDVTAIADGIAVQVVMAQGEWVLTAATNLTGVSKFTMIGDTEVTMAADQLIQLGSSLAEQTGAPTSLFVAEDSDTINIVDVTQAHIDWEIGYQGGTFTFTDMLQQITDWGNSGSLTIIDDVELTATILNLASLGGFQLLGNGDPDLRVDVVMDADNTLGDPADTNMNGALDAYSNEVGIDPATGVKSNGIATYVVTQFNADFDEPGEYNFYVCNDTVGVTTLGLQGNAGEIINFYGIKRGVNFLMEGDGYGDWSELEKYADETGVSRVGTLNAYFYTPNNQEAVVEINNQGVELLTNDEGGERVMVIDGVNIYNSLAVTINVSDGDATIGHIGGYNGAIFNADGTLGPDDPSVDPFSSLTLNAVEDLSIIDALPTTLTEIDATGVIDAFTATLDDMDDAFSLITGADATIYLNGVTADDGTVIDGSAGDLTLIVVGDSDLTAADLISVEGVVIDTDSASGDLQLTLTYEQVVTIGAGNISESTDGDDLYSATLHIVDYDGSVFDVDDLGDGVEIGTVTTAEGVVVFDAAADLNGADVVVAANSEVTMTVDQFMALSSLTGTDDGDDSNGIENAIIHLTGLTQAHIAAGFDLADVNGFSAATVSLAEDVVLGEYNGNFALIRAVDLNGFEVIMSDGQTLTLTTIEQSDGLVVSGGTDTTLALYFDSDPYQYYDGENNLVVDTQGFGPFDTFDASGWSVTTVKMLHDLVDNRDIELFQGIDSAICIRIYDAQEIGVVLPIDRCVIVEEGVTVDGFVVFNDYQGDSSVVTLNLTLEGGATVDGNIRLTTVAAEDQYGNALTQNYFDQLTINSNVGTDDPIHNTVNIISGDIDPTPSPVGGGGPLGTALENNLLDVVINANADLIVEGDIVFNSVDEIPDHETIGVGMDDAVLVINGVADVTLGGIDTTDQDLDSLAITNNSTGVLTLTLDDDAVAVGDENITINGSTGSGGVDLIIADGEDLDLSDAALSGINNVTLTDATLTLSMDQVTGIGQANILAADGSDANDIASGTLHIVDYNGEPIDAAALEAAGIDVSSITFAENAGVIDVDPSADFSDVDALVIPDGTVVNITADQFMQLTNGTVQRGDDGDDSTPAGTLNIIGLNNDHSGIDLSNVDDILQGSLSLDGTDDLAMIFDGGADPAVLDGFAIILTADGQSVTFSNYLQANGRVVTEADPLFDTDIVIGYPPYILTSIDASGYGTDQIYVLNTLVDDQNLEALLADLDSSVEVVVFATDPRVDPEAIEPVYRTVTILPDVTVDGDMVFNDPRYTVEVAELILNLSGNSVVDGDLGLPTIDMTQQPLDPDTLLVANYFDTLTINSAGSAANEITGVINGAADDLGLPGGVVGAENNLLNVDIVAGQDLTIGGIEFSAIGEAETFVLTLNDLMVVDAGDSITFAGQTINLTAGTVEGVQEAILNYDWSGTDWAVSAGADPSQLVFTSRLPGQDVADVTIGDFTFNDGGSASSNFDGQVEITNQGDDIDATATLNVTGPEDVVIGDLDTGDVDVDYLVVNHDGTGSLTIGLSSLNTVDPDDVLTVNGDAVGMDIIQITGDLDLSDDFLSNIDAIDLAVGSVVTVDIVQLLTIGESNFGSLQDNGVGTVNIVDYQGEAFDSSLLQDNLTVGVLTVKDTYGLVVIDPTADLSNVQQIVIPAGTTLQMTADQFESLPTGTITGDGTLNLTDFDSDNALIDLSTVAARAGIIYLDDVATEVIVGLNAQLDGTHATDKMFSFEMTLEGQSLTLSSESQADGRIVDGSGLTTSKLYLGFDSGDLADFDRIIEAAGFDVSNLYVMDRYIENAAFFGVTNMEELYNDLPSSVVINIFDVDNAPVDPVAVSQTQRTVVIEPDTQVDVSINFNEFNLTVEVATLDLVLSGGSVLAGNLGLPATFGPGGPVSADANFFQTLTIVSQGDSANIIDGEIVAGGEGWSQALIGGENNLLDVNIQATQDLYIGGIEFSSINSENASATAYLDVDVAADVTVEIGDLDTGDNDVDTLIVTHTGDGNLTFGLSSEATVDPDDALTISGSGEASAILTINITGEIDLSDDTLSNVDFIYLNDGATLTLDAVEAGQFADITEAGISGGANTTLNIVNYDGGAIDASILDANGIDTINLALAGANLTLDSTIDLTYIDEITIPAGYELTMTADQYEAFVGLGVDGVAGTFTGGGTLNLVDFDSDNGDVLLATGVGNEVLHGTITLDAAAGEVLVLSGATLGDFSFIMSAEDQTLIFSTESQADGREVDGTGFANTNLVIGFAYTDNVDPDSVIESGGFNVSDLWVWDDYIANTSGGGEFNFEQMFNDLPDTVVVNIFDETDDDLFDLDDVAINQTHRFVVIHPDTTVDAETMFDDHDVDREVSELDIDMLGGAVITGDVSLPTTFDGNQDLADSGALLFRTLTINSSGDEANFINGVINGGAEGSDWENNLLDVNIFASQDLTITQIEFSSRHADESFVLDLDDNLQTGPGTGVTFEFAGTTVELGAGLDDVAAAAAIATAITADATNGWDAVANGDGTITFTSTDAGVNVTDVTASDFVFTNPGGAYALTGQIVSYTQGGSDSAALDVDVDAGALVTIVDLDTADPQVSALTVTHTGEGDFTFGLSSGSTIDPEDELTLTGSTEASAITTINITGEIDLSDDTLANIDFIYLNDDSVLTLDAVEAGQFVDITEAGLSGGDNTTLELVNYAGGAIDSSVLAANGIDDINLYVTGDAVVDPAADFSEVDFIYIPDGASLTISADQFESMPDTYKVSGDGELIITGFDSDNGSIDMSGVGNDIDGLIILDDAATQVLVNADAILKAFAFEMSAEDQTLILSSETQADGRVVDGSAFSTSTLVLAFANPDSPLSSAEPLLADFNAVIEAGGYNISDLRILDSYIDIVAGPTDYSSFNFEQIINDLAGSVTLTVFSLEENPDLPVDEDAVDTTDRVVVIDPNTAVVASAIFNDWDDGVEVATLDLSMMGGSTITGNLSFPSSGDPGEGYYYQYFDTLTIHSMGDSANSINGSINTWAAIIGSTEGILTGVVQENNLLNVDILASQDLYIGEIEFSYREDLDPATATATLNVDTDVGVLVEIGDLDSDDDQVVGITINHTGDGDLQFGLGSTSTIDADDVITVNGSAAGMDTIVISGEVDLSDDFLSDIDAFVLNNGATLTLSQGQIDDLPGANGLADISLAAGAATLIVNDLGEDPFDASVLAGSGINISLVNITADDPDDIVTLDAGTDLTGVDLIYVPAGVILNLTAEQFLQLDGDGGITIYGEGTVNITDLTQADVGDGSDLDLSSITALQGTITLAEDVTLDPDTDIDGFSITLDDGQAIGLSSQDQADGRDIIGIGATSTVQLGFDRLFGIPQMDVSGYDISDLWVLDRLIELNDMNNVEWILDGLSSDVLLTIFDYESSTNLPVDYDNDAILTHREVVIEPEAVLDSNLAFNDLSTSAEVADLTLTLSGNSVINGDLRLYTTDEQPGVNGVTFEYLQWIQINSLDNSTDAAPNPNAITGAITGTPTNPGVEQNNVLDVRIYAEADLTIGEIEFSARNESERFVLDLNDDMQIESNDTITFDGITINLDGLDTAAEVRNAIITQYNAGGGNWTATAYPGDSTMIIFTANNPGEVVDVVSSDFVFTDNGVVSENFTGEVTITNQGGTEEAEAVLTVTGDADVVIGDLDTADPEVDALTVDHTGTGGLTIGLSELASVDATDVLTINGDAIGMDTIVISGEIDLSDDFLSNIDAIVLNDTAILTLTQGQIDDLPLGLASITQADTGATDYTATLNVVDLGSDLFDATLVNEDVDIVEVTIAAGGTVTLDVHTDLTGVDVLYVPDGTTLNLTAAQFQQLVGVGTIMRLDDGDASTDAGTVNITDLTNADVQDANGVNLLILAGVAPVLQGTITLAEDVTLDPQTDLSGFSITLANGQTIGLSSEIQADGRVIIGTGTTTVQLGFDSLTADFYIGGEAFSSLNVSNYDITDLYVLDKLVENYNFNNIEYLFGGNPADASPLSSDITITIFEWDPTSSTMPPVEVDKDATKTSREVVIEADTTVDSDIAFNDLENDVEVSDLTLTLSGNSVIDGDVRLYTIQDQLGVDGVSFDFLQWVQINSEGTGVNEITGTITGNPDSPFILIQQNNVLDVRIDASAELIIGGIEFSARSEYEVFALVLNEDMAVLGEDTITFDGVEITLSDGDEVDDVAAAIVADINSYSANWTALQSPWDDNVVFFIYNTIGVDVDDTVINDFVFTDDLGTSSEFHSLNFDAQVVTTNQGGYDNAEAVLTVTGDAPVTIYDIDLDDDDVDSFVLDHTGTGDLTIGLSTLATIDETDYLDLQGSPDAIDTLVITSDSTTPMDLSNDNLVEIDAIVLTDGTVLTMSLAQIDDLPNGLLDITVEDFAAGDTATLNIVDVGSDPFDATLATDGVDIYAITILAGGTVTLDASTDLTGVDEIWLPDGTTLNLTAAQFQQLEGSGTILSLPDSDPLTDPGTVNITDLTQEDVDAGLDLSGVDVDLQGTITLLTPAAPYQIVLDPDTVLGDAFAIELSLQQMITLSDDEQADGRVITGPDAYTDGFGNRIEGSTVILGFDTVGSVIFRNGAENQLDTSGYDISDLYVDELLVDGVDGQVNVEYLLDELDSSVQVTIFTHVTPVTTTTPDNVVVNDSAYQTVRTVHIDEGTTVDAGLLGNALIFNDVDVDDEVAILNLVLEGGSTIDGDLVLNTVDSGDYIYSYFQELNILSDGTSPNAINGIINADPTFYPFGSVENNLLTVNISANESLYIEGIIFSSRQTTETFTLDLSYAMFDLDLTDTMAVVGADTVEFDGVTVTLSDGDNSTDVAAAIAAAFATASTSGWTATFSGDVVTFSNTSLGTAAGINVGDEIVFTDLGDTSTSLDGTIGGDIDSDLLVNWVPIGSSTDETFVFDGVTVVLADGDTGSTVASKIVTAINAAHAIADTDPGYTAWSASASGDVITFTNVAGEDVTDVIAANFQFNDAEQPSDYFTGLVTIIEQGGGNGATATLNVDGTDDVTIGQLVGIDPNVTTIEINNNLTDGAVLSVIGLSPATTYGTNAVDINFLVITGDGDTVLGTDGTYAGAQGRDLISIDAHEATGDLDLGALVWINGGLYDDTATVEQDGFSFISGTGVTTLDLGLPILGSPQDTAAMLVAGGVWSFDFENAAAGSEMQIVNAIFGAGTLTINLGANTGLVIAEDTDMTPLVELTITGDTGNPGVEILAGYTLELNIDDGTGITDVDDVDFSGDGMLVMYGSNTVNDVADMSGSSVDMDLYGYDGDDTLTGGSGDDYLSGGDDEDILTGSAGDDQLYGGAEDDTLYGGADDDILEGGTGTDTLYGNAGEDTFVFDNGDSSITYADADTIMDFSHIDDSIDLGAEGTITNYDEGTTVYGSYDLAQTGANGLLGGGVIYAFVQDATNGYLFEDSTGDGTADQVIILSGINYANFDVNDLV